MTPPLSVIQSIVPGAFRVIFLYYFLLICAMLATVYAYRMLRTLARFPDSEYSPTEYFLGTDFGTTLAACLMLLSVVLILANSGPLGPAETRRKIATEDASYTQLGLVLGNELAESYLPPPPKQDESGAGAAPAAPPTQPAAPAKIPDELNVLVIDYVREGNDAQKHYHDLMVQGLHESLKKRRIPTLTVEEVYITFESMGQDDNGDRVAPELTWPKLDAMLRERSGVNAVVSLVGVPNEFVASQTSRRTISGEIKFAAVTDNSYDLGVALSVKAISVLIAPQLNTFRDGDFQSETPTQDFRRRYLVVTPHNFLDVFRDNPRLFRARRIQD